MPVTTVANVENNEIRIKKNMVLVTVSSRSSRIIVSSPQIRVILFCILPRSRERQDNFEMFKTSASIPVSCGGMDNNARMQIM